MNRYSCGSKPGPLTVPVRMSVGDFIFRGRISREV
jgi:hypothetical protein